jgi:hypothetical protein
MGKITMWPFKTEKSMQQPVIAMLDLLKIYENWKVYLCDQYYTGEYRQYGPFYKYTITHERAVISVTHKTGTRNVNITGMDWLSKYERAELEKSLVSLLKYHDHVTKQKARAEFTKELMGGNSDTIRPESI